jgi:hypothetical protein
VYVYSLEKPESFHSEKLFASGCLSCGIIDALIMAINVPPLPGLGNAEEFTFQLQDRSGYTPGELVKVANHFLVALPKRSKVRGVCRRFKADNPTMDLDNDRDKALKMGVALSDIYRSSSISEAQPSPEPISPVSSGALRSTAMRTPSPEWTSRIWPPFLQ